MRYKREEPFRYEFNPPLSCTFSIVEIDNKNINTGNADGHIIDLSPKGVKLTSKLNIPLGKQEVKIKLNFRINIDMIYVVGILVWRKELNHLGFQYGVKFVNISVLPEVIMEELKTFIKQKSYQ
ncbi:PilZ domain-containing protein [Metabacillus bambusae]|uniref:PilZ domain-containing protein n=1 Tax=Metabacillus bambusae TaxID=2795218 RepID=A0ABS3N6Q4_9BACI|nr:PilZ domain-containing protein [Metabacillus bambusae]MBO1513927.1 PilZ domain-containing protein [Metabacillus bambusae]